jgi:hypothetical protein
MQKIFCNNDRQPGEKKGYMFSWKCNEKDKGHSKHLKWRTVPCITLLNLLVNQAEDRRRRTNLFGFSEGSVKVTSVYKVLLFIQEMRN